MSRSQNVIIIKFKFISFRHILNNTQISLRMVFGNIKHLQIILSRSVFKFSFSRRSVLEPTPRRGKLSGTVHK